MNKKQGGTAVRDRRGRWKPGVSGNRSGKIKPLAADADFDAAVMAALNLPKVARALASRAAQGDAGALQQVLAVVQRNQQPVVPSSTRDYGKLSSDELLILDGLLRKAGGEPSDGSLLKPLQAVLATLELAELPTEDLAAAVDLDQDADDRAPDDAPDEGVIQELADITPLPPPIAPPPEPVDMGPVNLTKGLRRRSWLYAVDSDPFGKVN